MKIGVQREAEDRVRVVELPAVEQQLLSRILFGNGKNLFGLEA